jgi:hypothetical protein
MFAQPLNFIGFEIAEDVDFSQIGDLRGLQCMQFIAQAGSCSSYRQRSIARAAWS